MALGELGFDRYKIPFVNHWKKEIIEVSFSLKSSFSSYAVVLFSPPPPFRTE